MAMQPSSRTSLFSSLRFRGYHGTSKGDPVHSVLSRMASANAVLLALLLGLIISGTRLKRDADNRTASLSAEVWNSLDNLQLQLSRPWFASRSLHTPFLMIVQGRMLIGNSVHEIPVFRLCIATFRVHAVVLNRERRIHLHGVLEMDKT